MGPAQAKRFVYSFFHSLTALPSHRFKSGLRPGVGLRRRRPPRGRPRGAKACLVPTRLTHPLAFGHPLPLHQRMEREGVGG
jgi:hypothetical protein